MRSFVAVSTTCVVASDFVPNGLLLVVNCAGYLPYSDRPGPGWRVYGGLTAFLTSGLMIMAAGWYVAMAALGVWVAATCGLLWGAFVLPWLVPRWASPLPFYLRVAVVSSLMLAGAWILVKPLIG